MQQVAIGIVSEAVIDLDRRRLPDRRAASREGGGDRRSGRDRRQQQRARPPIQLHETLYFLQADQSAEARRVSLWNASDRGVCLIASGDETFVVGAEYRLLERRRLTGRQLSARRLSCLWQERDGCQYGGFQLCG